MRLFVRTPTTELAARTTRPSAQLQNGEFVLREFVCSLLALRLLNNKMECTNWSDSFSRNGNVDGNANGRGRARAHIRKERKTRRRYWQMCSPCVHGTCWWRTMLACSKHNEWMRRQWLNKSQAYKNATHFATTLRMSVTRLHILFIDWWAAAKWKMLWMQALGFNEWTAWMGMHNVTPYTEKPGE